MSGLSIIRKSLSFEANFTQIPNAWARDSKIGFRAKGILMLLMSHSDGWKTSIEEIAKQSADGVSAIRSAVEQLESAGYLTRTRIRGDNGWLLSAEWILTDPFEPEVEKPMLDKPILENQPLKNNTNKEQQDKEQQSILAVATLGFEDFWRIYPRKEGKGAARAAYLKAIKKHGNDSHGDIINGALRYAENPNLPDKKYIPHPATWINQERWTDEDLPTRDGKPNSTDLARDILYRAMELADPNRLQITDGHS